MKAVVQRVSRASVHVNSQLVSEIGKGFLVLVGIAQGDQKTDVAYLANKIAGLRIFEDPPGKMNLSIKDISGQLLIVPQFTLLGDCRKGRRPDFTHAASPKEGIQYYELICHELESMGLVVKKGSFQTHMHVSLTNDGPVTLILDSRK